MVEMLYREVVQAVLLFGLYYWVLSVEMERKVEGAHTGFMIQITEKQAQRKVDRTWDKPRAEEVR